MQSSQSAAASEPEQQTKFSHFSRRYKSQLNEKEVFACRYNLDSSLAAVTFDDGSLQIISTMLGDRLYYLKDLAMEFPLTGVAWHPNKGGNELSARLLAASCNGELIRWTASNPNQPEHIKLSEADGLQYHSIDYSPDGKKFALGGNHNVVEIFDEHTMKLAQTLGDDVHPAHTNRVYCCRYIAAKPHILHTGSWDRQIYFWDVRNGSHVAKIGGHTKICGDAVDVQRDGVTIVTGGGKMGEGLQLWDFRNLEEPVRKFNWYVADGGEIVNPIVNCARFVPN